MELRHLRYVIAVAEAGSLKLAAEQRLHTAQPSLSRQIRDLEREVGVTLLSRSVRGIELTRNLLGSIGRSIRDNKGVKKLRRVVQSADIDQLVADGLFLVVGGYEDGHARQIGAAASRCAEPVRQYPNQQRIDHIDVGQQRAARPEDDGGHEVQTRHQRGRASTQ